MLHMLHKIFQGLSAEEDYVSSTKMLPRHHRHGLQPRAWHILPISIFDVNKT